MKTRHSVRAFNSDPIDQDAVFKIRELIEECNAESGLNMQLFLSEPEVFSGIMARYGSFQNVNNYIALVGKKSDHLHERCGYYGEKIVLKMTEMGLCTCWVGGTYNKDKIACDIEEGERLVCVIAFGYSYDTGKARKSRSIKALSRVDGEMPEWFRRGMEAAQLAPTAMNQQRFMFYLEGNKVEAKAGLGIYTKLDLGIVKYHFELGAGDADWEWA